MHELSIAQSIIDIAEDYTKKNNASKVNEIEIEVGDLSGVVIEALEFAMDSATKKTMLENAKVNIIAIPGLAECKDCQHEYPVNQLYETCPKCNSYVAEIKSGKELRVKSLIVD